MYGYIPGSQQYQALDSDDNYVCTSFNCETRVVFCSPAEIRSLEARAQSQTRLCSECMRKRNERQP